MTLERYALLIALGLLLDALGFSYKTQEYWAVLLAMIAYGWIMYKEGHIDAYEFTEATLNKAKGMMEEVIARERKVVELLEKAKENIK